MKDKTKTKKAEKAKNKPARINNIYPKSKRQRRKWTLLRFLLFEY